jgi:hypothetical protein
MAAPSEEKLICDKFNLEALTVNQVIEQLRHDQVDGIFLVLKITLP